MTLWLYIARRFLGSVLACFFAVLFLAIVFDTLELSRRVGADLDVGFGTLLTMAALHAPAISIKSAPFVMLLAAMWTYARLARASELVVTRAAGVSAWGVASPTVWTAVALGVFVTGVYNPVAAALLDRYDRLEARVFYDDKELSVSREGLWLRQGDRSGQSVIHALDTNSDATVLRDVTILLYRGADVFEGRIEADRAELFERTDLELGFWRLTGARIWRIDLDDPSAPPTEQRAEAYDLTTELTREQILDSFAAPETIPFWRLPGFIATLQEQGFSARRHILHFNASLAAPLLFAAMAMLGGAFSMRHARMGGLGMMALYAALCGFAVYFVFDFAHALGGSGIIPPAPAAWGPPFAAMMLAAGLLLTFEDG